MKKCKIVLIIIILLCANSSIISAVQVPFRFDVETKPTSKLITGLNQLEIRIKPNIICDDIHLIVDSVDNLTLSNGQIIYSNSMQGDTLIYFLPVSIPDDRISGFKMFVEGCTKYQAIFCYFEPLQDTIIFHRGDPRWYGRRSKSNSKSIGISDEEFLRKKYEQEAMREQAKNDTTRVWVYDSTGTWQFLDKDSLYSQGKRNRMTSREEMLEMEKTPLTSDAAYIQQDIMVEGKYYTRNKGEYKFRPLISLMGPGSDPTILQREDSIRTNLPDVQYHFVFDLTDSSDYNYLKEFIENLKPMDKAGFYHGLIWKSQMNGMEDRNIPYNHYPKYPIDNSIPVDSKKK